MAAVIGLAGLLAACGSSGPDGAKTAQARVTSAEKAVTEANADLEAKSKVFCGDAQTYITALDRYGNVLRQTAPTVGDVRDGGSDLADPSEQAISSGHAAVEANQARHDAEHKLADAKADLAAEEAKAAGSSTTVAASTTTAPIEPLAPAATVDRVKQAETDLTTAQKGITDATPLAQASAEFNAAAVALEMSWLRLLSDAGCLTDEQQVQADAAVHDYTVGLQQALTSAGLFTGRADGIYGPETVAAVKALQQEAGLPVTGFVDQATEAALGAKLGAKGGAVAKAATVSVVQLQQTLKLAGYWDGPVDGTWTPALTEALKTFQTALGVPATGAVDAATLAAFEAALAKATAPETTTTTVPVTSTTNGPATTTTATP
ncbi:peptidoglycan-binding domain-containing protein [Aquihabitans sp. McL0605]|uniref:peptidoglycan-binding domain-containing protein n=1 Tax=Aquihabitans sp. McL0605 TaxID=3415671 RepID=UPI003CF9A471